MNKNKNYSIRRITLCKIMILYESESESSPESSFDSVTEYEAECEPSWDEEFPTIDDILTINKPYFGIMRTMADEKLLSIIKTKKIGKKSLKVKRNAKMCDIICAFIRTVDPEQIFGLARQQLQFGDHYNFMTAHIELSKTFWANETTPKCQCCKKNVRYYLIKKLGECCDFNPRMKLHMYRYTRKITQNMSICENCTEIIVKFSQDMIVEIGSSIIIHLLFLLKQTPMYEILVRDVFYLIFNRIMYS